jgi:hypothetical protein
MRPPPGVVAPMRSSFYLGLEKLDSFLWIGRQPDDASVGFAFT